MYTEQFLKQLEENPIETAKNMKLTELEKLLTDASNAYYDTDKPLINDYTFDELIDYLAEINPKSKVLKLIGSQPMDETNKVKLPYHLGSMDKIKLGSSKLNLWFNKYNGPYVISDKLDGLSGLLVLEWKNNDMNAKLMTRGNGTYGQDISHLLNIIKWGNINSIKKHLSKLKKIVVRGEIIINEAIYEEKYSKIYPKSRSLVAGIVNSKPESINKSIAANLELISYQLINPELIVADKQFELLSEYGFIVVNNKLYKETPKDELEEILLKRRLESKYKIDGIIITDCSQAYENPASGNPKYSIAFKMALSEQQAETIIEEIEYNISKNGVLKPRIRYEPVKIDGDTLTYTTGFNAKYIKDNKLGKGAKIVIIRSGDVIPYIKKVISPANSGKWNEPTVDYEWSETGVDAIAKDLTGSEYLSKTLLHFFNTLEVDGMKIGTINKLINAGFNTIETILDLKVENLLDVAGFNIKSAEKLINNIKTQVLNKEHKYEVLMTASNIFKGFGIKKLALIVNYMSITGYKLTDLTIDKLTTIEGFSTKTAKQIINEIPKFIQWQKSLPQLKSINIYAKQKKPASNPDVKSKVNGLNIVFTGFRDSNLENKITNLGGNIQSTVNSKTNLLIIKDETAAKGSKFTKAKNLNVKIITLAEFNNQYF